MHHVHFNLLLEMKLYLFIKYLLEGITFICY